MTNIGFPFRIDRQGRTARVSRHEHVRDLVEQLLFTAPGERVNRPEFGGGLDQLVFAPISADLVASTQGLVQGNLQRWLGDVIRVEAVQVGSNEGLLIVVVRFVDLGTGRTETARIERRVTS